VPRISAENAVPTMTIHAVRYEFDPAEITLKKGKQVRLLFIADDVAHGISIPGLNIDVDLPKHTGEIVTVTPQTAGDFDGECSKYCGVGHSDMIFTVHVTP
jgi:cytochrome c oxidase subunit II